MAKFTVVVRFPEFEPCDDWNPPATYVALVEAETVMKARRMAREEAMRAQDNQHRAALWEWEALLVFEGHLRPIYQR